jgi:Zn-dependent protease
MPGSLHLGKLAGITINVNVSWIIILVLLTWSLATGWFAVLYPGWPITTYWIISLIAALLLFVSVLLHEEAIVHFIEVRRGLGLHTTRAGNTQDRQQTAA